MCCVLASRESGIGNRESGIGNRESGIGDRGSGIGKAEHGARRGACAAGMHMAAVTALAR
ncbi:hypothetical protein CAI17_12125 [Xanthomonas citri pv. punicae]|nr:hypothetical protein CAI17_12125 [Xanthomonas citri pv. punicae]QCZ89236.1 hypothetical protein DOO79_08845 [Xanthomonas citri pv. punicae]